MVWGRIAPPPRLKYHGGGEACYNGGYVGGWYEAVCVVPCAYSYGKVLESVYEFVLKDKGSGASAIRCEGSAKL